MRAEFFRRKDAAGKRLKQQPQVIKLLCAAATAQIMILINGCKKQPPLQCGGCLNN